MFLEREDEGGERELGRKLRILNEEDGENDQGKTWFYLLVPRFSCHCEFVSKAASTSVLCCSRPASSWQYEMAIEFHRGHGRLQLLEGKGGGVEDDGRRPTEFSRQSQSRDTESTVRISPQPTTQEPNLASFTDDVHTMVKRLLTDDKSFRVIPIMGIEGIGKTTLAKLIFNNKHVLNHFLFGVWTSDGYEFHLRDKEKLMDSSLSQLGDVWNYHVELQRLKAFLIDKRSLIVLDDTHIPFLDHVLRILAESSNGSRMILTTHKISLPPNFRTRSDPHLLRLRGDDESWALFTHALKKSIPPELLKLKDKIVRRCGGLPLLIVKLAEALSHKDATIEEWSTVLQQFHHDQQQLWSNTLYKIHKDLSLYMRRCLFYFTLFPQDFDIPARRLITFMVITIRHLVDHLDKEDVSFDHIHGDYNRTSTSFPPYYEDVLSFMSFDTRKESKPGEDIGNFLRQSISSGCFLVLLVLDLENVFRPKLPEAIGKLTRLRGTNFPTILQTLCELFVDEETPAVVDWVLKQKQLRSLRLKSIDQNNQPWDLELKPLVTLVNLSYIYLLGRLKNPSIMSQFPYSLIDLTLSASGLVEDPMQSLDRLPNLRSLKLLAKSYLGKNMLALLEAFLSFEFLNYGS
ncbi:putative disease resistance RPP13-like protein 2 [Vitis vinifera]|uniref:Putative disease resistance RPP13-like protein 2 n=1 Tax=Vitis vinifera TaxID=29760 RepID=A0A438G7C9_VITVI|nr:putative disease resistance RPP13-like protein 2 [Vitis vinifera]